MTRPESQPRHPLELLESLLGSAESAAAARLEQMHGHLSVGHRASGYDGTAAQIHAQYAQALAPIVQALRAQAEAEAGMVLVPRDALSRVAADPYYYRDRIDGSDLDESLCFGCNAEEGDTHNPDCPMMTLAAALAQAGGEG